MLIEINGHIINYEILNKQLPDSEKTVLVFLHDGLGSIKQWKDIPLKICKAAQLSGIVYDRVGYGLSESKNKKLDAEYLHDEALIYLPELLLKLGIHKKVILIDHSDGGSISLLFASFFPEKVLGVISEAAHVFVENITWNGIKNLKAEYQANPVLMKSLKKYHGSKTDHLFNEWTDLWLSDELRSWNVEALLKNITIPVLAIQGEKDEYGSFSQIESIQRNVNAAVELHFIPDCRHFPHFEKEKEVLLMVNEFINKQIKMNLA